MIIWFVFSQVVAVHELKRTIRIFKGVKSIKNESKEKEEEKVIGFRLSKDEEVKG